MILCGVGHHLKSPNPRFFPIFSILRKVTALLPFGHFYIWTFYHLGTFTQVHMPVTFVCVEKNRRELDEKKSIDLLFNMGTTCYFSLPKLKIDFGLTRLVVKSLIYLLPCRVTTHVVLEGGAEFSLL